MKFSKFGERFQRDSGIHELMEDLDQALNQSEGAFMLGGGNPGSIPEIEGELRSRMKRLLDTGREFEDVVGRYNNPAGELEFIRALCGLFEREYGWELRPENIILTNGSQNSFFYLFNLLAGEHSDGEIKKILLPLIPEYIGYADTGLRTDIFSARKPEIEILEEQTFKYRIDFEHLELPDDIAALCVSRPTNPTGNVLDSSEIERLSRLAGEKGIPLIVDGAYGPPFPDIVFTGARPLWNENIILILSLSKFGLPGMRTGIVIASPEIIAALIRLNAVTSLATGGMGPALMRDLVESGRVLELSRDVVRPFYLRKAERARTLLLKKLKGHPDVHLHRCEGAFFLWAWFRDLPITSRELYHRLKKRGVVVVPGDYYFPGFSEPWRHKEECLRISYARPDAEVAGGLEIIAAEVLKAYG